MRGLLSEFVDQGFTAFNGKCQRCNREGLLPIDFLVRKFGTQARLSDLEKLMRCSDCNHLGTASLRPSHQVTR